NPLFPPATIAGLLVVVASLPVPMPAAAQSLDLAAAAGLGSGVSLAPGEGDTVMHASPAFLDLDVSGVLDGDAGWEYGAGVLLPVTGTPALGFVPRVRRARPLPWLGMSADASLGLPLFVSPYSLAGLELGAAARYPVIDH